MRRRILFDAMALDGRPSGAARRLVGLLGILKERRDLEVAVLCARDGLSEAVLEVLEGVRFLLRERAVIGPLQRLRLQRLHLKEARREFPFDLLVTECAPFPRGQPLLLMIHDLRRLTMPGMLGRLYRRSLRNALEEARLVHVPSAVVASGLRSFHPPCAEKIHVVPNGVDARVYHPGPADLSSLTRRGIEVPAGAMVVVGHLEPRKDPLIAVRVRRVLGYTSEELPLVFVGRGPLLPEEELFHLRGALPGVRGVCLRDATDREVAEILRASRLLLAPARLEGFGMAPLEAASSGLPVVASDIPAHREVLGDGAFFAPAGDAESMAGAVRRILGGGSEVEQLRRRALARAGTFSWEAAAEAFMRSLAVLESQPATSR